MPYHAPPCLTMPYHASHKPPTSRFMCNSKAMHWLPIRATWGGIRLRFKATERAVMWTARRDGKCALTFEASRQKQVTDLVRCERRWDVTGSLARTKHIQPALTTRLDCLLLPPTTASPDLQQPSSSTHTNVNNTAKYVVQQQPTIRNVTHIFRASDCCERIAQT
eukprot:gene6927-9558_t